MKVTWLAHLSERGAGVKANFELFIDSKPTDWWVMFLEDEASAFVGKSPDGQIITNLKTGSSWAFLEDAKAATIKAYEESLGEDVEQQCVVGKCDYDVKEIHHNDDGTQHEIIRKCTVCHFESEDEWTYCDCGQPEFDTEDTL